MVFPSTVMFLSMLPSPPLMQAMLMLSDDCLRMRALIPSLERSTKFTVYWVTTPFNSISGGGSHKTVAEKAKRLDWGTPRGWGGGPGTMCMHGMIYPHKQDVRTMSNYMYVSNKYRVMNNYSYCCKTTLRRVLQGKGTFQQAKALSYPCPWQC